MADSGLTPGYGLLSGLADGLKQGLITYNTQNNIRQQRQMEGAIHGLVQDPGGNWGPTPLLQKQQQAQGLMADAQIRDNDPSSPLAAETASKFQQQGILPLSGASHAEQMKYGEGLLTKKFGAGLSNDRMEGMRASREKTQANRGWDKEFGGASPISMRLEGAVRMKNLIGAAQRGEIATTEQFMARANAEMTALETGKNNFALGSQERTEMENGAAQVRGVINKWLGEQKGTDLRKNIAELSANIDDMTGSYMDQAERRAGQMEEGATDYGADVIHSKHEKMKQQYTKALGHWGYQPSGVQSPGAIPEQSQPLPPTETPRQKLERLRLKDKQSVNK